MENGLNRPTEYPPAARPARRRKSRRLTRTPPRFSPRPDLDTSVDSLPIHRPLVPLYLSDRPQPPSPVRDMTTLVFRSHGHELDRWIAGREQLPFGSLVRLALSTRGTGEPGSGAPGTRLRSRAARGKALRARAGAVTSQAADVDAAPTRITVARTPAVASTRTHDVVRPAEAIPFGRR